MTRHPDMGSGELAGNDMRRFGYRHPPSVRHRLYTGGSAARVERIPGRKCQLTSGQSLSVITMFPSSHGTTPSGAPQAIALRATGG